MSALHPSPVPALRVRAGNRAPPDPRGRYVLYWMTSFRRTTWNFALQRAAWWCRELGRPLLVFEPLRAGYPWACDRFHRFVAEGMADNELACLAARVAYFPYLEPRPGEGKGLLAALSTAAAVVVADDFPGFFLPRMIRAAAGQVPVRLELVDSNGLLPLRAADRTFGRALDFRRFLQNNLLRHLQDLPSPAPLAELPDAAPASLPAGVAARWPRPLSLPDGAATVPVDRSVPPGLVRGGAAAAGGALRRFLSERLGRYAEHRNHPDDDATSGLSPYLHFGHLSAHEAFAALATWEGWTEAQVAARASGRRTGWWGMGPSAEAFLDQLVTWRELGFNHAANHEDGASYGSLPAWARAALGRHRADPRPYRYARDRLEAADTHDGLWNAAQRQLVREGRIHGYLRMLWGKKILEWSETPEEAFEVALALNDRYALDGRDPNSTSGVAWCFGRYDRPWGPERPVFGSVRTMSSRNTARKVRVKAYLEAYGR